MMTVLEYAEDVNKTVEEILRKCKELNIKVSSELDLLDDIAITELDNTLEDNNEELEDGIKREIFEKTGMSGINVSMFDSFGSLKRSPLQRMIALAYIGVVDSHKVNILKETLKTSDSDWFPIDNIPPLAYDHQEILNSAINDLKIRIIKSDILKSLYPNGFTMPEIQKVYETILKCVDKYWGK